MRGWSGPISTSTVAVFRLARSLGRRIVARPARHAVVAAIAETVVAMRQRLAATARRGDRIVLRRTGQQECHRRRRNDGEFTAFRQKSTSSFQRVGLCMFVHDGSSMLFFDNGRNVGDGDSGGIGKWVTFWCQVRPVPASGHNTGPAPDSFCRRPACRWSFKVSTKRTSS